MMFENYDLENVVTPVNSDVLESMLQQAGYDENKTRFLVEGF